MNWWEWIVFVTGVAAVGLTVKQHLANWPIGIANSAALLVVAWQAKLYSDGALQVFYIVLGFYGWWHWLYGNPTKRNALPVTRTPVVEGAILAVISALTYVGLGALLAHVTDTDVPFYDAFPTTASLLAQYLLTRKYLANWPIWIFLVNVPYVALYLYKDLPLLAALQPIYIALSVWGWVDWRRSMVATSPRDASAVAEPTAPGIEG
jgi:nicotinamide mononucleotide transporter